MGKRFYIVRDKRTEKRSCSPPGFVTCWIQSSFSRQARPRAVWSTTWNGCRNFIPYWATSRISSCSLHRLRETDAQSPFADGRSQVHGFLLWLAKASGCFKNGFSQERKPWKRKWTNNGGQCLPFLSHLALVAASNGHFSMIARISGACFWHGWRWLACAAATHFFWVIGDSWARSD